MLGMPQKASASKERSDGNLLTLRRKSLRVREAQLAFDKESEMKRARVLFMIFAFVATVSLLLVGCQPPKSELVKRVDIADNEMDPAVWGKAYPTEYELWKKTEEPTAPGKSVYKKGFDADNVTYDKLSEFPFLALLFNGWGFGVEYNEPRGHAFMIRDQLDIDPSRIGAGGVCLSCKTPYAPGLQKTKGMDYYSKPYKEMLSLIPEKHQKLGVACIDCHDNKDMALKISRGFTLTAALKDMGGMRISCQGRRKEA